MSTISIENAPGRLDGKQDNQTALRRLRRENAQLRQELQRMMVYRTMAYRDCLTGLHNRRYFDERLREECARAMRVGGYAFGVVLIDVDDFKTINDTLGHSVGDQVLTAVANFLKDSVREVDLCCRLGGDEFAILLPTTDEPGAHVVEDRLRTQLAAAQEQFPCPVSLSVGMAAHPPGPADVETLLARADQAMYEDKRRRKSLRQAKSA
ncbi:MAG: two-component system cell cycle response regulator [Myxococcota bacterium]|jgi:two-component system cell cycle response regulator